MRVSDSISRVERGESRDPGKQRDERNASRERTRERV